jgi:hypothetical protein
MGLFASPLERAISDHDDALIKHAGNLIDVNLSEAKVNHTRALVVAEHLLARAYRQAGTKEPWVSYEVGYKPEDADIAQLFLDTVHARLAERKAVMERYSEDDSIVVEGVELVPAENITEVIDVKAPLDPFQQLREDFGAMLPVMMRLYPH